MKLSKSLFVASIASALLLMPAFSSCTYSAPKGNAAFELVRKKQPLACLVIDSRRYPLKADKTNIWAILDRPITTIAGVVSDYVAKSTGAKLPVIDLAAGQPPQGKKLVYIGRSDYVDRVMGKELDKVDASGYLIRVVDGTRMIIAGQTSEGTEYGTYEFLEKFAGIRWLMPTDIGDYVPRRENLSLPAKTSIKDEPAFMQVPAVAYQPTQQLWARRMRFWTRISFHHNLSKLFPPQHYTKTHPEFYPVLKAGDTKRYQPGPDTEDWQPCFTAPGIVDEAAKNIIRFLDANPEVKTYSFGINDSFNFCQCERCRAEYIPGEKFLDYASYSDAYFKFVNPVIEKVLKVHPDTWFGCLAYTNVSAPPVNVKVHPRLIPFLTYDTMQLLDVERRKVHEGVVRAWGDKCTYLGRYDYTYGDSFVPPRIYIHQWADYVRWARGQKFKAWYAETYPFFGEAPKYYVMAKIWWNPDRDVDTLLNEWYRLSFGKAAAPMKAYFDHWENYWTKRVPQSDYFRLAKEYQILMGAPGWLEKIERSDIDKADGWIEQAEKLADSPETRARVKVIARSWEYYRTILDAYQKRGTTGGRLSVDNALALLNGKDLTHIPLQGLTEELKEDPILRFSFVNSYSQYGSIERASFLDAAETWLDSRDQKLKAKLGALAQGADKEVAALSKTALAIAEGSAINLVPNGDFEAADPLDGWWADMHQGTGKVKVTTDSPASGKHAVEVTGTVDGYGGVMRTVPIKPGKRYLLVVRGRWQGQGQESTSTQIGGYFNDAAGGTLSKTVKFNAFRCGTQWGHYMLDTGVAPAEAATATIRVDVRSQPKTGHRGFLDAIGLYEVAN